MSDGCGKTCTKCGAWKGFEAFPTLLGVRCKACITAYKKQWALSNRERIQAQKSVAPSADPDYRRQKYQEQKDAINATRRARRAAVPDVYQTSRHAWCQANKEKLRAAQRERIRNNPTSNRERVKKYHHMQIKCVGPSYAKSLLAKQSGLSRSDIPPELVEFKREQLQLHRLMREFKQVLDDEGETA